MVAKPIVKGIFKKSIIEEEIKAFPFELTQEQIITIKKCLIHDFSVLTAAAGSRQDYNYKSPSKHLRKTQV